MYSIIFISTVHKEIGKCNADELCAILERINPEVVFLEALENTYSTYHKTIFSSYGVYHQKLEIKAIQKYNHIHPIKYIPVLESGLTESFDKKYDQVSRNMQYQLMLGDYDTLASEKGFEFLNSIESIELQQKLREFEKTILNNNELNKAVNDDLDTYENSMLQNIYSYSKNSQFEKAVFMCGVAHRYSIIKKIERFSIKEEVNLNWKIYGD